MSKPWHLLTKPHHLAARFFWSLDTSPPSDDDERWVRSQLRPGEVELWEQMTGLDRRHSVGVARQFLERRPDATRAEIAGALLHDVGKIVSGLSTWERVLASIVGGRTERFRQYQDHERIGAELAAAAGSDPATVDLIAERGPAYRDLEDSDR